MTLIRYKGDIINTQYISLIRKEEMSDYSNTWRVHIWMAHDIKFVYNHCTLMGQGLGEEIMHLQYVFMKEEQCEKFMTELNEGRSIHEIKL